MIKRCLILLFIAALNCELICADNYAFLISAGKATSATQLCNAEYWSDLYLAYEYLLLHERFDSTKVYVFYGDGLDYDTTNDRYKNELHNWGQITDYDNSYSTLFSIIPSFNNIIKDDDNLFFFWVVGHGNKTDNFNDDTYQVLVSNNPDDLEDPITSYTLCKTELVSLINSLTHYNRRKVFWMTCHSGAMGGGYVNINNNRTTLITSSTSEENSYSNNYGYPIEEPHTDFGYALFSISTKTHPDGTICNLNQYFPNIAIQDSLLSINELHSGIGTFINLNTDMLYRPQHPCIFDYGGISNKIFLGENKELKNVTIDNNNSYWLDQIQLSDVVIGSDIDITIDVDIQSVIEKNTFVPLGTTFIIK